MLNSNQKLGWNKNEWLEYLEAIHPADIEMGLGRVQEVAKRLDLFKPAPFTILVGGTNGKGTTTALLKNILAKRGFSSGLYNSPHIHVYNERINACDSQGQSRLVSDDELIQSFIAIEEGRGDIPLTYFEFGTLAAIWQIKQWSVDVAILEIGLGGRLDACNIVSPDLSIVTSVGFDHQDWLGDTLDLIGYEKAGIGRKDKPLICGQKDVAQGFIDEAKSIGAESCYQGVDFSVEISPSKTFKFSNENIKFECEEYHVPYWNIASTIQALSVVGLLPESGLLKDAISETRVEGRLSEYAINKDGKRLNFVLDVAHNPQAASFVGEYVSKRSVGHCDKALLAMLVDKNPASVVEALPFIDSWSLAGLDGYRGQTAEMLLNKINSEGSIENEGVGFSCYESIDIALNEMAQQMKDNDTLLVIGSFFTVNQAVLWLHKYI